MRIIQLGTLVLALVVVACDGGGKAAPELDAFFSTCGNPGDVGNEIGIGKFCEGLEDCQGNGMAFLCSVLGSQETHFCTKTCRTTDPMTICGTGAQCVCNAGNSCGCTPSRCLGN